MTRRAKGRFALSVALSAALVLVANPVLGGGSGLRTSLFAYPPSEIQWQKGVGVPEGRGPNQGLYMANPESPPFGLAGAIIQGAPATITTLGFEYRGDCYARTPRFRVWIENGDSYIFGCQSGIHTPAPGAPPEWQRVRFGDGDAVPYFHDRPWPGFANVTVQDLRVSFGSREESGPQFSGLVYLDNIAVNDTLIGKSGKH